MIKDSGEITIHRDGTISCWIIDPSVPGGRLWARVTPETAERRGLMTMKETRRNNSYHACKGTDAYPVTAHASSGRVRKAVLRSARAKPTE